MNLYKIEFQHYSPKDSGYGIKGYLIADSDEKVFEWFNTDPTLDGQYIYDWRTLYGWSISAEDINVDETVNVFTKLKIPFDTHL